jgi:GH25 family lysozyme M1 (1,4-beta-N-acetylmuramidase)
LTPRSPLPPTLPAAPGSRLRAASRRSAALAAMLTALTVVPAGAAVASTAQASTAQASTGSAGASATAQRSGIRHLNTGATHSPRLLRELAHGSGATGSDTPGPGGPASLAMRAGLVPATTFPVLPGAAQGIDVSSHQEQYGIDWTKVAAAGIQFAAIKVTEGDYYVNPYYQNDMKAAKGAGLSVIAYAFAIPNGSGSSASPVVQADDLITNAAGADSQVPEVMLDIEYNPNSGGECYGLTTAQMTTWISAFAAEIHSKTGQLPIIYTTQDWWNTCTGSSTALGQDQLWIARYTTATSPAPLPAGWSNWNLWQYTSVGTVNGIATAGHTDLDQLNPAVLTVQNPGIQQDAAGAPVSVQVHASMSGLDYTATGLPPGLTVDASTGQISGTSTATGAYPVTVTATDPVSHATASVSFTWDVYGTITVTPPASQSTVQGSPADFLVQAADSATGQAVTFTATGLPPAVSISSAGRISGWPGKPGSYQVKVTASDSLGASNSAVFSWTVGPAADHGPTGSVLSTSASMCLDDVGDQTTSGAEADSWPCNGSSAQLWTYVQDGTLRIHGLCLTVPGSPPVSGSNVRLETCTGVFRQQWQPAYPRAISPSLGASATTLLNPWSGMCLTDPSTAKGTRVVIGTCSGTAAQSWTLPAGRVMSQVPGKCLDDAGDATASGTKVDIQTCSGTTAQRWSLKPGGTVRVHGMCLGLVGQGTAAGTGAALYTCDGSGSQLWHLYPEGGGLMLRNPRSGRCLTDPAAATADGTQLELASCTATPARLWRPA